MTGTDLLTTLHHRARQLGFDLLGVSPARPPEAHLDAFRAWLARGDHGEMAYMARPDRVERREEPALILAGVRTVICAAVNYCPPSPPAASPHPLHGRIARYAWGEDYHSWMLSRLEELAHIVRQETGGAAQHRSYVDTGPLLERSFAAQAGLGFVGKNTCLIHPRLGSWLFLGELLVDIELPLTGAPSLPRCGTCTRCIDACPTGALTAPYRLDARRCISYLTIELKGAIPPELRPLMGDWLFGCDLCQEVCPWQRFARPTGVVAFQPRSQLAAGLSPMDVLTLDEDGFQRRFAGSPIARVGRGRLLRNAAVVLGNLGTREAGPALVKGLSDPEALVRSHAAWALGRVGGPEAVEALEAARAREGDLQVRKELAAALDEASRP